MEIHVNRQIDSQAVEVLKFMARNVQGRPMLYGLLMSDIHRWSNIPVGQKKSVFARDVRRFSVACPHLANKDRILHALEALDHVEFKEESPSGANGAFAAA
jgi:hypothetical protein